MNDRIIGSIIVIIGFFIATVLALMKKKSSNWKSNIGLSVLFVLWMIFCASYIVYHFMNY